MGFKRLRIVKSTMWNTQRESKHLPITRRTAFH